MNTQNNEIKNVLIIESDESIIDFLRQTISLIGFNNIRVEKSFDFDTEALDNISIFTNIDLLNQLSEKLISLDIKNIQTILYQTDNQKITNFWNNGLISTNSFDLELNSSVIYVRTRGKLEKIYKKDILYVESDKKYCTIITRQKKYVIRTALKNIDRQLKDKKFIRVHRSFLINQDYIQYIDTQNLNIEIGTEKIAIGRRYQEELFNQLMILH